MRSSCPGLPYLTNTEPDLFFGSGVLLILARCPDGEAKSNMQSNPNPMYARLCGFGLFFLVGGVIASIGVMIGEARMNATETWPSVAGRIVVSEVSTATVRTGPVRRVEPIAKIHFAYSVNGRSYQGEGLRVAPMLHTEAEGTPTELVSRYPVGKAVEVYYDPANPSDSLLIPRAAAKARQFIRSLSLVGGTVAFIGLLMAGVGGFLYFRPQREAQPTSLDKHDNSIGAISEAPTAAPAVAGTILAPSKSRATHWLLRTLATILGLVFLLFGSLLFLASLKSHNPSVSESTVIVARGIFFGVALLGGGLVYFGVKK
jgi:hypothetical protein